MNHPQEHRTHEFAYLREREVYNDVVFSFGVTTCAILVRDVTMNIVDRITRI